VRSQRYGSASPACRYTTADTVHVPSHPAQPTSLSRLNAARQRAQREEAWAAFLAEHSDLVVRVCRSVMRDADAAMDAYAFVIESLRENEYARLRDYVPAPGVRFETWLVVVCRRLALDHYRRRFGRPRSTDPARRVEHLARRNLLQSVASQIDPDLIPDVGGDPAERMRREQLLGLLRKAVADLAPADRLLLTLRFVDERPIRDVARALGFSTVFHVYRRLRAVLGQLRAALERSGVDGPEP
jgi:RNA polymerase sigma factor (sigma-70 family)